MKKILIINTGGTFNKVYNPLTGNLDIEQNGNALQEIQKAWLHKLNILNIIGKDSLDLQEEDRKVIENTIKKSSSDKIIVIHGTDTIDITAKYLSKIINKTIILTGAMKPFSINPIEATGNLASAYGFLQAIEHQGIYISMNGIIKKSHHIIKNKERGFFEEKRL